MNKKQRLQISEIIDNLENIRDELDGIRENNTSESLNKAVSGLDDVTANLNVWLIFD